MISVSTFYECQKVSKSGSLGEYGDLEVLSPLNIGLQRKQINQPFSSNLYNFVGFGYLFGSQPTPNESDNTIFWHSPSASAAETPIKICNQDQMSITFDLGTLKVTEITYFGVSMI